MRRERCSSGRGWVTSAWVLLALMLSVSLLAGCQENTPTEPAPPPPPPPPVQCVAEICGDGLDNDCDQKVDDADEDCQDDSPPPPPPPPIELEITFTAVYAGDFTIRGQIDNDADKITVVSWELFLGNLVIGRSADLEPSFDVSVIGDRCGVFELRVTMELEEGFSLKRQPGPQSVDVAQSEPECEPPQSSFNAVVNVANPLQVDFENTGRGAWNDAFWQFGDGGSSDFDDPSHIYACATGTTCSFTVSLELCGHGGCSEVQRIVTVVSP